MDPKRIEMRLAGMILQRNGRIESVGVGAACLGHPYAALLWLARTMATAGKGLKAGEIVLTGALGPMVSFRKGDHISAEIQGLVRLDLRCI